LQKQRAVSRTRNSDNKKPRSTLTVKYKRQLPRAVVAAINVPQMNKLKARQQHTNLHTA